MVITSGRHVERIPVDVLERSHIDAGGELGVVVGGGEGGGGVVGGLGGVHAGGRGGARLGRHLRGGRWGRSICLGKCSKILAERLYCHYGISKTSRSSTVRETGVSLHHEVTTKAP